MVDKGSKIFKRSMKSWLEKNDTEMYSAHNEGKSVTAKIFTRTVENQNLQIHGINIKKCVY